MASRAGTVLLTGANGFVASHILSGLIERNFHIVAAVRSERKAQEIVKLHPTWESNITFIFVPDITAVNAFNEAFQARQIDYVIHTASPLNFNAKDIQEEVIRPAIEG